MLAIGIDLENGLVVWSEPFDAPQKGFGGNEEVQRQKAIASLTVKETDQKPSRVLIVRNNKVVDDWNVD